MKIIYDNWQLTIIDIIEDIELKEIETKFIEL